MTTAEAKLKERVKELTCLYEVTSIIVNSDYDELQTSLEAIVYCLKRAWQFENDTEVYLQVADYESRTKNYSSEMIFLQVDIKVFNRVDGLIKIGYPADRYSEVDFLEEERTLLHNVSLAIGNLMERKQIRDSEMAAKRQVERADRLHILGEITAGIAHELNTPLANILGFAELLKDKVKNKENYRDLEKIIENAVFSREIVKKLMFFACEMPHKMDKIQLNTLVENALKLLSPSLNDKNIQLKTSFSHPNILLRADSVQLTQVLFNLIMNAIYYSPKGGKIEVVLTEQTKTIQICIYDEGKGIAPKDEDKVFEPFFTTKPIGEGSGLGLSAVHGIIDSHKGKITHRPNTPKGTIFTIDFPKL
ncbi:sensor histidine kinase [Maribacter chungangensis]|uniref:histidine kinase n=1 Tax=Maribacter chungangensis TaxID=1069117 RepID=A0ABW3BA12_9FLAO